MKKLILLLFMLLASRCLAGERVARQGDDEVHVFDSPCVSAQTIARIPEDARYGWGKVQGRYNGERFFGCWRPHGRRRGLHPVGRRRSGRGAAAGTQAGAGGLGRQPGHTPR